MIRFVTIQGDVLVDDAKNRYSQMATSGLELDGTGNYLIATTQNSSAQIQVGRHTISLGQSSFLRISRDRTWVSRHYFSWQRDFKLFLGKIWSLVANDPRDPEPPAFGGGGGVRG